MKYDRSDYVRFYQSADLNKDKKLTYDEVYEFMRKNKMNPDQSRLRKYFCLIDRDRDGDLSVDEWCRFCEMVFADQII